MFHLRDSKATLAVPVKARITEGALVRRGRFSAQVRSQTFRAHDDLDVLLVLIDNLNGAVEISCLVPPLSAR